jgi:hypothetical protein
MKSMFNTRFGRPRVYGLRLAPISVLPRPFAIAWGAMVVLVGRPASGELSRGIAFASNRIKGASLSASQS